MSILNKGEEYEELLYRQLGSFWNDFDRSVIHNAIPSALQSVESCFGELPNDRSDTGKGVKFSPYISIHWMIFLYRLSRRIYENGGLNPSKEADQVYYLNKIMHSTDWYYAIDLPVHFLCEHPLGSVLGRAQYGDYFFVYQGTTVGGNRKNGRIYYPVIGNNVILFANATVLGDTHIGNNVVLSADSCLINENVPDNCMVFGKSPDIIIKKKSVDEIKSYTEHIWGWDD